MSNIIISDQELIRAATIVREAMLNSLPEPEECHHNFSLDFQAKVKRIYALLLKKKRIKKLLTSIAAAILMLTISASMLFTVNAKARSAFIGWVNEIFDHISEYFLSQEGLFTASFPEYYIDSVPLGFEMIAESRSDTRCSIFYSNSSTLDEIIFEYYFPSSHTNFQIIDPSKELIYKNVFIDDFYATLYFDGSTRTSNLVWLDSTENVLFVINSTLGEEEIIALAKNVLKK